MGITETLARLAVETPGSTFEGAITASTVRKVLDTVGIALAGSRHPSATISLDLIDHMGSTPRATVIGHPVRTSSPLAAYVNGVSAHALEYDDYTKGVTHVSVCLVPGALAVAEELDLSGRDMVTGFAVGFEVESRIARGMRPQLLDRGWHPNGVLGAIGVAVAAGRMMGFDVDTMRMAMSIAASQSSGVRKNVGSMGKAFHVGHGARCGVFAALLAQRGYKVDPNIIEGTGDPDGHEQFGFADTFNGVGEHDLGKMEEALGTRWELAENTTNVRLHPGSTAPAAAIDGMIDLTIEHDIHPAQVAVIRLETTPQCRAIACYEEAPDSFKARFCLPYSMAVSLIDRKAGLAQYTDERVRRDDVQTLMKRVEVSTPDDLAHHRGQWGSDGVNWGAMRLAIELTDGTVVRTERTHARGWTEEPPTWDDLVEKYTDCAQGVLTARTIDATIDRIAKLDQLHSVRELMADLGGTA